MNASARKRGVLVIALVSRSPLVADQEDVAERRGGQHRRDQHPHPAQRPHALVMAAVAWYCLQTTW